MMAYSIIKQPSVTSFRELPKANLKRLFDWFIAIIPERMRELERVVREAEHTRMWCADRTPESLVQLGEWLACNVETRPRSASELDAIESSLLFPVSISAVVPNDRSVSLGIDIGMYLGEVLRALHPSLVWSLKLGGKSHFDYGRPVLEGFHHGVAMNPVHIVLVLVQALARGSQSGARLMELYEFWARQAPASPRT